MFEPIIDITIIYDIIKVSCEVILMARRPEVSARKDIAARLQAMEDTIEADIEFLDNFFDDEEGWGDWYVEDLY